MSFTRREFLRTSSLVVLGAGLVACGKDSAAPTPREGTVDDIIAGRSQSLSLFAVGTELLPNIEERLAFGLGETPNIPNVQGATGSVWIAKTREEKALGPFPIEFHGEGLAERGYYEATVEFPSEGQWLVLVEAITDEGALLSAGNVQVGARNQMPKPGDAPIRVETPTMDNARGVDPICTMVPDPCGMHKRSLADALDAKEDIVLIIATPAYCTSNLCGPEVELLDEVRAENPDITFIHVEVLKDDDPDTVRTFNPLAPAAIAWKLEEEPATYTIRNNKIVQRLLGPADRKAFASAVEKLKSS